MAKKLSKQELLEIESLLGMMVEEVKRYNTTPNFFDNKYELSFKSKLRELSATAQSLLDSPRKFWGKKHNRITILMLEYAELVEEYYGVEVPICWS
jgi:hypothetical protein